MKSLEEKSGELAAAEERANKAENQLSLLRSRIASLEEDLKKEQQRRRDEIDELHRSKELAVEELEARQRELTDAVEEWKGVAERGDYGTVKQLREDLDQLRETAEEEVANLTIRLQDLESARRKEVGKLQASLTAKQNEMSATTTKLKQQVDSLEQRAKEKENANRQLQRQVATYESALTEANSEIEALRDKVSKLQKEVGEAEVDMLKKDRELRSLHGDAAAAQKEVLEELAKEVGGTPPIEAGISTGNTKKSKGGGWLGLKGK
ncbi:hypothetical protein GUITHDRAFT_153460 [Guillardia theta CCMP2712]|uniref:Myosin tail domain-containing protein n=1 Tax=Guillardia theta (strain CCMP2712) TaxID=905079 RepID=L1J2X9_GUITC|nr:hypothetical protein GUITHDRAFT_153460 [Guillardia theta CCMP2712]EKX42856.1 hypothetical protein GUITHDRAFT_153460 [Guillardia theta CCMP2712]|eukprot:XP_005829836.1 hypothetical protein GUITHDRAFT_153460 [Guillardia theta CCMP2712]